MSDLIEFYKNVLEFVGMTADEDGLISVSLMGTTKEITVNGQRLCLPIDARLRNPGELVFFHPLCESILYGESEVNERFRQVFNIRLNAIVVGLMSNLLRIAASPSLHTDLTPTQSKIITYLKYADEKLFNNFTTLAIRMTKENPEKALVNVYVKRSGEIKGKHFARVGITRFNFLDILEEEKTREVFGVKLRTRSPDDASILKAAFRLIFPESQPGSLSEDIYNVGSDSKIAPFFDATLRTALNLASRVNEILDIFSDHIAEADHLRFTSADKILSIIEQESEVKRLSRFVPALPFNEGRRKKEATHAAPNLITPPNIADTALSSMRDKPTTQPAKANETKPVNPVVNPAVNRPHEHPTLSSVIQQPYGYNQNTQQPQQQQQPARSGRPTLTDITGMPATQPIYPQQNQPRVPTWAIPNAQPGYPQPGYPQPGYPQPGYQQPMYQQPTYQQPVYNQNQNSGVIKV